MSLPESTLIKSQTIKRTGTLADYYGKPARIVVKIRHDDECGNGHNSFAITATIYQDGEDIAGGCCHKEIAQAFPDLAPLIKWHLCSTDGPMHYLANTVYLAGDRDCWGLRKGEFAPGRVGEGKAREFDAARSAAIWPEATDEQLSAEPEQLKAMLLDRLPALMVDFKAAVESLGLKY